MSYMELWAYQFKSHLCKRIENGYQNKTLDELALELPQGVYTTIRTYQKKCALHLDLHLERMVESIRLSGHQFEYDITDICACLYSVIKGYKSPENRLRLHIPFSDLDRCYLIIEELTPYPKEKYAQGVGVKTNQLARLNPKAKLTSFIQKSQLEKQLIRKYGLDESIIMNADGELLEGMTSNFFAVREDTLYTAEDDILHGITRKFVIEEATAAGYKIIYRPIRFHEIDTLSEVFITSTSRGVLPVNRIDNIVVADGLPGPITLDIMQRYNSRIQEELKPIFS